MSARINFVRKKFAEYYQENAERIYPPASIERREFGFMLLNENRMIRHKSFQSEDALKSFIVFITPSDVYYSSAYYEKPEEVMQRKVWLGADLTFDIDSDHIDTPCKKQHLYWVCKSCENAGVGELPKQCSHCGGSSLKEEAWLCEICLEAAKTEILKLVEFLVDDFGFPSEEIEICFSGQRGYHARVFGSEVIQLDQASRKEIVDYISGTGLITELYGWRRSTRELIGPDLKDPGWQGRVARGVYGLLSSSTLQLLEQIPGITTNAAKILATKKDFILNNWDWKTNWGTIKGIDAKIWAQIIQHVVNNHRVATVIDTVVTTDIHRLIRLPLSLHGKTGLMALNVPINSLERFDPLKSAVAFKNGTLKVYVTEANQFRIGDKEYGPYEREVVILPMAAAIYLLCKKVASIA